MKLHNHFKTFLEEHVNLNDTRLSLLTASVEAVKTAVRRLAWEPEILGFEEQGSWARKTIIKPQSDSPFDADLLVLVEPVPGWEPKDYINNLATQLNGLPCVQGQGAPLFALRLHRVRLVAELGFVGLHLRGGQATMVVHGHEDEPPAWVSGTRGRPR